MQMSVGLAWFQHPSDEGDLQYGQKHPYTCRICLALLVITSEVLQLVF